MVATAKTAHYLLYCETHVVDDGHDRPADVWRFLLQSVDGGEQLEASDRDDDAQGDRAALLAVVRGLEALDGPSRVTLVTSNRYVRMGLAYGLDEWRDNDWQWERFGRLVPIKHDDLWRRVDRALAFHTLECRTWRVDGPHRAPAESTCDGRSLAARVLDAMNRRRSRRVASAC